MAKRDFSKPGPIRTNRQISEAEERFRDSGGNWQPPKKAVENSTKPTVPLDHNDGGTTAD